MPGHLTTTEFLAKSDQLYAEEYHDVHHVFVEHAEKSNRPAAKAKNLAFAIHAQNRSALEYARARRRLGIE